MARVRQVTRTIESTECEVMTVNTKTKKVESVVIMVSGTYNLENEKDEKSLNKAVAKSFANQKLGDDVVMVSITSTTTVTMRYRMLEDDFIKLAESEILALDGVSMSDDLDDDTDDTDDDTEE